MNTQTPQNFREDRLHKLIDECSNTVIEQIIQPFGLSVAMFNDKEGGGVDTIHNAREGVYASETEKGRYENRGDYDPDKFHKDPRYIAENKSVKERKDAGAAFDAYTKEKITPNSKIDLDHTISAKEAHDDAGTYLAGKKGEDLVNTQSNLHATNSSINRSKGAKTMDKYISDWEAGQPDRQKKIAELSQKTDKTGDDIKALEKLKQMENFSPEEARKIDKEARKQYEKEINEYYKSEKFAKAALTEASSVAVRTAIQQVVGKVLIKFAQATFSEMKSFIREIKTIKENIYIDIRMRLKRIMNTILEEIKNWKEIAKDLGGGFFSGFFSTLVTTLINVFATTAKRFGRAIREGSRSIIETFKMLFFRPKEMTEEEALKAVIKMLSGVFITTAGIAAETSLNSFLQTIPVIGQFASIITPVLLGILSGISIALVSYTVDIIFDIFNKSSREFDNFLTLHNLEVVFSDKLTQVLDSFVQMGREYSKIINNYDDMIGSYSHMTFQNECLLISGESMNVTAGEQHVLQKETLSLINQELMVKTSLKSEFEKTKQWLEERKKKNEQR